MFGDLWRKACIINKTMQQLSFKKNWCYEDEL